MGSQIRRDRVLRIARRTLACPTAPYQEGQVIAWVREFVAARPHLRLREDPDGNLELRRRATRRRRSPLVLAAHMDHPGFRALRSWRRGDAYAVDALFLGGVRPEYFQCARARFFTRAGEIPATVLATHRDRRRGVRRVRLAARRAVPPESPGMWELPGFRRSRRQPDRIETRAADDLAGVAAVLALFDAVDAIDPEQRVDVRGLFTRAEEVGFVGALAVARHQRLPRGARIVAIEASKALPEAPLGAGPILRVGDRASVFDDGLTRWIAQVGARLAGPRGRRFAWQRKLMDGGTCESTAYQAYGYRCAAMCLPLGNYHNMAEGGRIAPESIRLSDLVGLVRFFEGMVGSEEEGASAARGDSLRSRLEERFRLGRRDLARDPFAGGVSS